MSKFEKQKYSPIDIKNIIEKYMQAGYEIKNPNLELHHLILSQLNFLSPIHQACIKEEREDLEQILKDKGDPNLMVQEGLFRGFLPIHFAVVFNRATYLVEKLVEYGADINAHVLADNQLFLGNNALIFATFMRKLKFVYYLVLSEADKACQNIRGDFPLLIASMQNLDNKTMDLLYSDELINTGNKSGITPLIAAAQKGNLSVIKYCIEHKAKLDHKTLDGQTFLDVLAEMGYLNILTNILEEDCVPTPSQDQYISMALNAIKSEVSYPILAYIIGNELVPFDYKDINELSFLAHAVVNNNPLAVELLADVCDINSKDEDGRTALILACQSNMNPEILNILLSKKVDVKIKDRLGHNANYYYNRIQLENGEVRINQVLGFCPPSYDSSSEEEKSEASDSASISIEDFDEDLKDLLVGERGAVFDVSNEAFVTPDDTPPVTPRNEGNKCIIL